MSKSNFFTGQPIFSQLINFLPKEKIQRISKEHHADRYCKKFNTYHHLVTIMYSVLNKCDGLREITTGLLGWEQRLTHLGMTNHPRRSTLSDANTRRPAEVFEAIYLALLQKYGQFLPDSRNKKASQIYIFDSTSISLFQEVLRAAGLTPANGKQKGGIKVHTLMRSDQDVPCFIKYSSAVANDSSFLKEIKLPKKSVLLFDRGYNDYRTFNSLTNENVTWVTLRRVRAVYEVVEEREVSEVHQKAGVVSDQVITLGHNHQKNNPRVKSRLVIFIEKSTGKRFEFITNNLKKSPLTIAALYQRRWQIEVLFKRLKQNYPLRYFNGDSENAIKIQIWCVLIVDLLLKIIKRQAAKKWAFSNLVSMIRLHLMTYIDLFAFLKSPEKALLSIIKNKQNRQNNLTLFSP